MNPVPARPSNPTARPAFTLLELMVAMALSSLVMLMVATTIATAVRASGAAAVDVQQDRREDRGRALLDAQMSWIELLPDSREPRVFTGTPTFVEFGTVVSARRPHERVPVRARYAVLPAEADGGLNAEPGVRIVYMEWPNERFVNPAARDRADLAVDALQERLDAPRVAVSTPMAPSMTAVIVDHCASAQVSYLFVGPGGDRMWDVNWIDPRSLPRAVRVSWTTQEGVEGEWIVPVVATF